MAHKKNVKTWIRMIEEKESKILYENMKIDYLQGKYLAPLKKIYEGQK
jgi:EAL domain-containing protein (putative c-di-GMP-specific phosphodiesterase class I)